MTGPRRLQKKEARGGWGSTGLASSPPAAPGRGSVHQEQGDQREREESRRRRGKGLGRGGGSGYPHVLAVGGPHGRFEHLLAHRAVKIILAEARRGRRGPLGHGNT